MDGEDVRIGIIGGGICGLVCAYELMKAGVASTIFEKEGKVGGRIQTESVDGIAIDTGANTFSRSYKNLRGLIPELNLKKEVRRMPSNSEAIYANGELLSYKSILFSKTFSKSDLIKIARLSMQRELKNVRFPPDEDFYYEHHGQSWGEELRKEYSDRIVSTFLDPVARAVTMRDSKGLSAAFGKFIQALIPEPKFMFRSGFRVVIAALEERILGAAKVLKNARVVEVNRSGSEFTVALERKGERSEVNLDVLVCTTPVPVLNTIYPECKAKMNYAKSVVIIARGRKKEVFRNVFCLAAGENPGHILGYTGGEVVRIMADSDDFDLGGIFENYEIIKTICHERTAAVAEPGCMIPSLSDGTNRFYMGGDFYFYPSVEAAVTSGKLIAKDIVEHWNLNGRFVAADTIS